jgi:isopenicillin-N epimerase
VNLRSHWQLNPEVDFLNHGSFGATPTIVLEAQRQYRDALERDPIEFLAPERQLEAKLDLVRSVIAGLVGADAANVAFVRNTTDAVNAVLRSLPLKQGDEIVITNHGYNACNNAARFAAERAGAVTRTAEVPFPIEHPDQVVDAVAAELSTRTRILLIDHVTSPTGLVFPIERLVRLAHEHGTRVLVDGAHAPGMVSLNLRELNADYYTANHHKWLCAPKVSGFLHVRRELQTEVRSTVISHAANRPRPNRSRFLAEFDWNGTYDPTPLLCVPPSIEFLRSLYPGGLDELMSSNRRLALEAKQLLCDALGIENPSPDEMIGSLVAVPLPPAGTDYEGGLDPLQVKLFQQDRIEVPIFGGLAENPRQLRISLQAYNEIEQVERLARALRRELNA